MEIIVANAQKKQARDVAVASHDPTLASLPARAGELHLLANRPEPAAPWRRARGGALQFSVLRAFCGCGDSCLRPEQFRATNCVRLAEACGQSLRARIHHRWRGLRSTICVATFHRQ